MSPRPKTLPVSPGTPRPFQRAVLRGLAILMPPLLTIVLFIWAFSAIERYVLVPIEGVSGWVIRYYTQDVMLEIPPGVPEAAQVIENGRIDSFKWNNRLYTGTADNTWVGRYPEEYIKENYLRRSKVLPPFIAFFLGVLYLLGKFVAAPVGRMIVSSWESLIHRLPLVSNVYSSVKQVTDFVFSERDIEFNRVVAVEYPRKGIWSIGFVTSESMLDIRSAANEPVMTVFMPTSPLPMTGFTITIKKSEAVDLDITIDQAIQFVVSCGVVIPPQQQVPVPEGIGVRVSGALSLQTGNNGQHGKIASAAAPPQEASPPD